MVDHLELKRKGEYICICLIHSIRIDATNRLECEIFLNQENLDSSPLRYKQNRVRTHTTHDFLNPVTGKTGGRKKSVFSTIYCKRSVAQCML